MEEQKTITAPSLEDDLKTLTPAQFNIVFGKCRGPAFKAIPDAVIGIAEKGNYDIPKGQLRQDRVGAPLFEYAEHFYLGDSLRLLGHDDKNPEDPSARRNPFTLSNGLVVTYGQINGLAGDFFGTPDPISGVQQFDKQKALFTRAFKTLDEGDPVKPRAILDTLQKEVDAVNQAIINHESLEKLYERLDIELLPLLQADSQKGSNPGLDYESLLKINIDHFAPNSHQAYNAGHTLALEEARNGNLAKAYTINAFADHFLEDSFASGHCRVPRVQMLENIFMQICSNFMHNEDNLNGLTVSTPGPDPKSWLAYGDSTLFDETKPKDNMLHMHEALKASVAEVYEAHNNGSNKPVKSVADFQAWTHAPSLESLMSQTNYCPMFKLVGNEVQQRKGLYDNPTARPSKWEFESVIGDHFWNSILTLFDKDALKYLYWAHLAYNLAPEGSIRQLIYEKIKAWLNSYHISGWIVDTILKWLTGAK